MRTFVLILAIACLIRRAIAYARTRDPLELANIAFWILLAASLFFPSSLLEAAVVFLLIFIFVCRMYRAPTRQDLRPLTPQEESEREDLARQEEEESSTFEIARHVPIRFRLEKPGIMRTTSSGEQTIEAGIYDGEISLEVYGKDEFRSPVTYHFLIKLPQRDLRSSGSARDLCVPWICDIPEQGTSVYWSEAPAELRSSFEYRCIGKMINGYDDSRRDVALMIGGDSLRIETKHSAWSADLAVSEDGTRLILRVRNLLTSMASASGEESPDFKRLPVFCSEIPIEKIVPITRSSPE